MSHLPAEPYVREAEDEKMFYCSVDAGWLRVNSCYSVVWRGCRCQHSTEQTTQRRYRV